MNIPGDAVAYFVDDRDIGYLLYGPDLKRRVVYLRPASGEDLIGQMERANVFYLYASVSSADNLDIMAHCERQGRLRHLAGRFYVLQ
jgi:hypothetical protein